MREAEADLLVCAHNEFEAVEDVGSGAAPDVGFAELGLGVRNDGCDVSRDFAADAGGSAASGEVESAVPWRARAA